MCVSVFILSSCKDKPKTEDIIVHKSEKKVQKHILSTPDYKQNRTINWLGNDYTIEVHRFADKSMSIVEDENGNKYYDNRINVRILRNDGSEFLNRAFTKSDFSEFITDNFKEKGALLGIVFDKAEENHLKFAASVGSPDKLSDEYIPMTLTISRTGEVSIKKDTQLDSGTSEEQATQDNTEYTEEDGV